MLEVSRRLGYVIQDGGLFPHLNARDNVILVARYLGWEKDRDPVPAGSTCQSDTISDRRAWSFPGPAFWRSAPRVSLMRALFLDPKVILLDEPLGALDPMVRAELQADLRAIFRSLEKTVVMVTHDLAEAAWFGNEIMLMRAGQIIQRGERQTLLENPRTHLSPSLSVRNARFSNLLSEIIRDGGPLRRLTGGTRDRRRQDTDSSRRLQGFHRIGDTGRNCRQSDPRRRSPVAAPPGAGWHTGALPRARGR